MITNVFSRIGMVVVSLLVVLGITGGVVQAAAPDSSLLEKITFIQTKVTNILDYLTGATDGLPGIKTDIAAMDGKVDTLIGFADVIDVTTDGLTDPINAIKTDTTTIKNYTDTLEATLAAMQHDMVKMQSGSVDVPYDFEYSEDIWQAEKAFNFGATIHVTITVHTHLGNGNTKVQVGFPTDADIQYIEPISYHDEGEDTVEIYEFDARYFKIWGFTVHHSTATMYMHYTFTYPNPNQ